MPKLFSLTPKAPFEIRPVEPFRAQSAAGGSYMRAERGRHAPRHLLRQHLRPAARARPGTLEALYLHEAIPGHHFQIALQQELTDAAEASAASAATPRSAKAGACTPSRSARSSASTPTPTSYFGYLQTELWRAIRLVVDTGLHSKGWTREQVIDYMLDNSADEPKRRRPSEAERYIAIPGQALAYKIGELKIKELRATAEKALGADSTCARSTPRARRTARCRWTCSRQDRPLDRGRAVTLPSPDVSASQSPRWRARWIGLGVVAIGEDDDREFPRPGKRSITLRKPRRLAGVPERLSGDAPPETVADAGSSVCVAGVKASWRDFAPSSRSS